MKNMLKRAISAALLNRRVFREVAEDPGAILHAMGIVILAGIGLSFAGTGITMDGTVSPPELGDLSSRLLNVWVAVMIMLVSWALWGVATYLLGSRFLGGGGGFRTVLRALGISYGPGVLMVAGPVHTIGAPIYAIGLLWVMVVAVVAVHEIQNIDWVGAFLATFLGWFICFVVLPLVLKPLMIGT